MVEMCRANVLATLKRIKTRPLFLGGLDLGVISAKRFLIFVDGH